MKRDFERQGFLFRISSEVSILDIYFILGRVYLIIWIILIFYDHRYFLPGKLYLSINSTPEGKLSASILFP